MTDFSIVLQTVTAIGAVAISVALLLLRRQVVQTLGHAQVDRITTLIGEVQLSVNEVHMDVETLHREFRKELDDIHRRLEYLEQRDRELNR